VLYNIKFDKVATAFSQANYWLLLPLLVIMLSDYLVRTYRWQIILNPTKHIKFRSLYPVLMIGFMANNLLPARIGEFVRAYTLSSREKVGKTLALATIILERVFDGLTLIALMGVALLVFPSPEQTPQVRFIEIFSTSVFAGAILFLVFLLWREDFTLRLVSLLLKPLPRGIERKVHQMLNSFVLGLHALKNRRSVLVIIATSVVVWLMEATCYYLMLLAFNLQNELQPMQLIGSAFFVLVFVNLGSMIPSSPGYVGVFQAMAVLALGAYKVDGSVAFSLALLMNSLQYIFITGIGLGFFSAQHMSFKTLKNSSELVQSEESEESNEQLQPLKTQLARSKGEVEMVAADS
jgi:uncharacterized protein (TIRG00374 family)